MGKERRRSSWWQLWLLLPLVGIAAFLEARASLSPAAHRVVEAAIILVVYGLVYVWLRANQAGLLSESRNGLPQTRVETVSYSPLAPGMIAGSNDNGHHESAWYVPTHEPDVDPQVAFEELGG